ncbi:MAG: hypothetical protein ACI857_000797 [Arenicella sp.]|jgi:hypothetical protein
MLRNSLLFLFILGFTCSGNAQNYLPVARDGKWGLIDFSGNYVLKPKFDLIRFHPKGDKYVYYLKGKCGIMNPDGSIYSEPEYDEIELFTRNLIASKVKNDWKVEEDGKLITPQLFDTVFVIEDSLYALEINHVSQLFNDQYNTFSENFYEESFFKSRFLHCKIQGSENYDLLNPKTLEPLAEKVTSVLPWHWTYGYLIYEDSFQLYTMPEYELKGPKFQSIKHQFDEYFLCKNDTNAFLFNEKTEEITKIKNVDLINDLQGNKMVYTKDGLSGIVDIKSGKQIFPAKYASLALDGNTIFTKNGSLVGIAKTSGTELFEPIYEAIEDYDNLFVVKKSGFFGICNTKGKEVEPCKFREISVFDNNVKCYRRKTLTTLNVSSNGTVQDRMVYDSYMKVSFKKARRPRRSSQRVKFGDSNRNANDQQSQANMKGWYQREMKRTVDDTVKTIYGSWGLKDELDSLKIKYQYRQLEFISDRYTIGYRTRPMKSLGEARALQTATLKNLSYDITINPNNSSKPINLSAYSVGYFQVVNQIGKYKLNPKEKYKALKISDWGSYALARGCTKTGVLVDSGGYVLFDSLTYIGNYIEDKLLICEGGEQKLNSGQKSTDFVKNVSSFYYSMGFRVIDGNRKYPYYTIRKGKWYFVNKKGEQMNEKPFDFAYDFRDNGAIVIRKGKWGVVDTNMNEIVPIIYDRVWRTYIDGEVFFKVKKKESGRYLYNRANSSYEPTEITSFEHYNDELLFIKNPAYKNGSYGLLDTNLNQRYDYKISEIVSYSNDMIVIRDGDENHHVINSKGKVLFSKIKGTKISPIGFGRYKIFKSKFDFYIIDASGKILIDRFKIYKILDMNKDFIVYHDSNLETVVWSNSSLSLPAKMVIKGMNPKNKYVLLQKGKKKQFIYSLTEKKFILEKISGVYALEDNGYLIKDSNKKIGMVSYNGIDTVFKPKFEELAFEGKEWGIAKVAWKKFILVDRNGERIDSAEYSIIERREDHYIVTTKNGKQGILNLKGEVIIPAIYKTVSKKNDWRYEAYLGNSLILFDLKGKITYERVDIYEHGLAPKGHYYRYGLSQFYFSNYNNPNLRFEKIEALAQDKFILTQDKVYGVYNMKGDTIVPIEFHNIRSGMSTFSVRYFNSYGQIDIKGNVLFDAKKAD